MPSWEITIRKGGGGKITFDPDPLNAEDGDLVIFINEDDEPHLVGTANNATYFMPEPIAPGSASTNFVVSENPGPLVYVNYDVATTQPDLQTTGTINVLAVYQIAINKTAIGSTAYSYSPSAQSVVVGGKVSWMNNDDVPHWPGIPGYNNYFMDAPIPPGTSSLDQAAWVADPNTVNQTLTYSDSLDTSKTPPTGTISVTPAGTSK
jgi:plastocyanin